MNGDFSMRLATKNDVASIEELILTHGPNEWNHLPEDEIHEHVLGIHNGSTHAIIGSVRNALAGVVTYTIGQRYPQYQPEGREDAEHGYLAEAVTHASYTGQGIGSALMHEAIRHLFLSGMTEVYAMRHSDNAPSAKMMMKAGMEVVDIFDDPDIRPTGSRKTVVTRIRYYR